MYGIRQKYGRTSLYAQRALFMEALGTEGQAVRTADLAGTLMKAVGVYTPMETSTQPRSTALTCARSAPTLLQAQQTARCALWASTSQQTGQPAAFYARQGGTSTTKDKQTVKRVNLAGLQTSSTRVGRQHAPRAHMAGLATNPVCHVFAAQPTLPCLAACKMPQQRWHVRAIQGT